MYIGYRFDIATQLGQHFLSVQMELVNDIIGRKT